MDPAAYHNICNLTTNVAVSRPEAETWKKCLLNTADEKIKVQKNQLTLNLLRRLQRVGVGVNFCRDFCKEKLRGGDEEGEQEEENGPIDDEGKGGGRRVGTQVEQGEV